MMKPILTVILLVLLSGCATPQPFICSGTDEQLCTIEAMLYEIKLEQKSAAWHAAWNNRNHDRPKSPRTHAEMMCAANPFEC